MQIVRKHVVGVLCIVFFVSLISCRSYENMLWEYSLCTVLIFKQKSYKCLTSFVDLPSIVTTIDNCCLNFSSSVFLLFCCTQQTKNQFSRHRYSRLKKNSLELKLCVSTICEHVARSGLNAKYSRRRSKDQQKNQQKTFKT